MGGHRVTGLPTGLPTSDSDAASWAHAVHLVVEATTNNGAMPERPLYLTNKRYVDEKDALCVLKSGDTMAGNLLLSAGTDLVRLLGCTDLTPGKRFSLALGNLQNQMQFEVIAPPHTQTPLTLKTTHGFLQRAAMLASYKLRQFRLCPSHAGNVSKRRHVARCSFHCRIAKRA